jgi:hypothetical protein
VIDHSVQVDEFGRPDALLRNTELEYARNQERYVFLRWGQNAFRNFRVVPPKPGSSTKSTWSTWRGCVRAARCDWAGRWPSRIRSLAPTRTPP